MSTIYLGKTLYPQPPTDSIRQLQDSVANRYAKVTAYIYREQVQGKEYQVTYEELRQQIRALAAGILAKIGSAGSLRLGIIGENSFPWVLSFNAACSYLGVALPLDVQLPDSEALHLMERGKVDVLCYATRNKSLARLASDLPQIKLLINMGPDKESDPDLLDRGVLEFDDLLASGLAMSEAEREALFTYTPTPDSLASIVFTSGTTAAAKGVMLSHQNIAANAHSCAENFDVEPGDRALSVLPLHHTFENTVGMFTFWNLGLTICINDGLRYILKNMQNWHIGIMMVVPAIAENIHRQIMRAAKRQKMTRPIRWGMTLSGFLRKLGIDRRRSIFKSILDQLGGKLHLFVCGGAPLDPSVALFFDKIGIHCLPGYGLTEAAPVLSVNLQTKLVPDSVGWPMPHISLKIDEDMTDDGHGHMVGEVLAKGKNIMMGYLDNPEATKESFTEDGWLRTGDLGYFDKKDALHLTGRRKSMLVLNNGKKAFPEEIEQLLAKIPGVDQCFVWDEPNKRGNIDICAILHIADQDLPLPENPSDEEVSSWLSEQIHAVNKKMPIYKAVNHFLWTEDPLIMTTTLKVKRPAQLNKIHDDLRMRGLTMEEADGLRLSDTSDLVFPDKKKN